MEFEDWLPVYEQIVKDLGIDPGKDAEASRILSSLLEENEKVNDREETLLNAERILGGRTAYVFGSGPDIEEELSRLITEKESNGLWFDGDTGDDAIIAADGATSILMQHNIVPDIIVSDMDGGVEDQLSCLSRESNLFIHAHADNVNRIRDVAPRLHGLVLGTTQVSPSEGGNLDNFGGFSDGDRAAFIAHHFGATRIILLGFNFNEVGDKVEDLGKRKPLSDREREVKFKKLAWASILLGLITRPEVRFYSQALSMP